MSWEIEETNKRFTEYLEHESDELSDFWDYNADQQRVFDTAFTSVRLDCEVDLETGLVRCWGIDGVPLVDPVWGT